MATLNLEIDSTKAEQAAAAFKKVLDMIQASINIINGYNFNTISRSINSLVAGFRNLNTQVTAVTSSLGQLNYTLNSIVAANHAGKLQTSFTGLRDVLREMRGDLTELNNALRSTASASTTLNRQRTQRQSQATAAPPAQATSTALVPYTGDLQRTAVDIGQINRGLLDLVRFGSLATDTLDRLAVSNATNLVSSFRSVNNIILSTGTETGNLTNRLNELRTFNASQVIGGVNNLNTSLLNVANNTINIRDVWQSLSALNVSRLSQSVQQFNTSLVQAVGASNSLLDIQKEIERTVIEGISRRIGQFNFENSVRGARDLSFSLLDVANNLSRGNLQAQEMVSRLNLLRTVGRGNFGLFDVSRVNQQGLDQGVDLLFTRFRQQQQTQQSGPLYDREANRLLTEQFNALGNELDGTDRSLKRTKTSKDALDRNMRETANGSLTQLHQGFRTLAILLSGFTFIRLAQDLRAFANDLLDTGRQLQHTRALFAAAAGGNVQEAERLSAVARRVAQELGTPLVQTQENFAKLAGAARGTSLEGKVIEEVFKGVSTAVAVLGTGSEKATNIIKVFTDILGKGRVQSEEVVKQFGNAVPGAFRRVADALGRTTAQLTQDLQRGTLTIEEVIPRVAAELDKIFGAVARLNPQTIIGSFELFKNSIIELKESILVGGAEAGFVTFFQNLSRVISDTNFLVSARQIGEVLGSTLVTASRIFGEAIQFAANNWQLFASVLTAGGVITALITLVSFIGLLGIGLSQLGVIAPLTAGSITLLTRILTNLGFATAAASVATKGLSLALRVLFLSTGVGALISLTAAAAYFLFFRDNSNKATEEVDKFIKKQQELLGQAAPVSDAEESLSRALVGAFESVNKELRTFTQDQRAAAEALDLLGRGFASTSVQFESFQKASERLRALERRNIFEQFGADADRQRSIVGGALRDIENRARALEQLIDLQKQLNQLQSEQQVQGFTLSTARGLGTGLLQEAIDLQAEYDRRVIPELERVQNILQTLTDPEQIEKVAGAFNSWNRALRETVLATQQIRNELRLLTTLSESFRGLQLERTFTRIRQNIIGQPVNQLTPASDTANLSRDFIRDFSQRIQLQARELPGREGVVDQTGKSFAELFGRDFDLIFEPQKTGFDLFNTTVKEFGGHVKDFGGSTRQALTTTTSNTPNLALSSASTTSGLPQAELNTINRIAGNVGIDPQFLAALRRAENGRAGREFGVLSVPAPTYEDQARIAAQTIKNNAERFARTGGQVADATGRYTEEFIKFFSSRYAPIGAGNDPTNLNSFHARNLINFYNQNGSANSQVASTSRAGLATPLRTADEISGGATGSNRRVEVSAGIFSGLTGFVRDTVREALRSNIALSNRPATPDTPVSSSPFTGGPASEFANLQDTIGRRGLSDQVQEIARRSREQAQQEAIEAFGGGGQTTTGPAARLQAPVSSLEETLKRFTIESSPASQRFNILPEDEAERQIAVITAVERALNLLVQARTDGAGAVQVLAENETALLKIAEEASERFFTRRVSQGTEFIRSLEIETAGLQNQIDVLQIEPALREVVTNAIQRHNAALRAGAFVNEENAAAARNALRALSEQENRLRSASGRDQFVQNLREQTVELQNQFRLLQVEPRFRDVVAQKLQQENELRKANLTPEDTARVQAHINQLERLGKAYAEANGPLRQYIDSIDSLGESVQRLGVSFATGLNTAITDTLFDLGKNLDEINKGVREAEARANARVRAIPAFEVERRAEAERLGREEVAIARENQPSAFSVIAQPFFGFLEQFSKQALQSAVEQVTKPLLNDFLKLFGLSDGAASPEVQAIQAQTDAQLTADRVNTQNIVSAIQSAGRFPAAAPNVDPLLTGGGIDIGGTAQGFDSFNDSLQQTNNGLFDVSTSNTSLSNDVVSLGGNVVGLSNSISQLASGLGVGGGSSTIGTFLSIVQLGLSAYAGTSGVGGTASASEAGAAVQGFRDAGFTQGVAFARGGIAGIDAGGRFTLPSQMFSNAPKFENGGFAGSDTFPALLTPGEGVFTAAQMRRLAPAGSGGVNIEFNMQVVTNDADSFRRSESQILSEFSQALTTASTRTQGR